MEPSVATATDRVTYGITVHTLTGDCAGVSDCGKRFWHTAVETTAGCRWASQPHGDRMKPRGKRRPDHRSMIDWHPSADH